MRFVTTVTVTGADDSVTPAQLLAIARAHPEVEFGLLLARANFGRPRFPSQDWLKRLADTLAGEPVRLAGHLCGPWVRETLLGDFPFAELAAVHPLLASPGLIARWQLNTHGQPHHVNHCELSTILRQLERHGQGLILQHDGANAELLDWAADSGHANLAALYDISHGAGVRPGRWPAPVKGLAYGYAGGLAPGNLAGELTKIGKKIGCRTAWIDAETRLRSNHNRQFDLGLVRQFLAAAEPFRAEF